MKAQVKEKPKVLAPAGVHDARCIKIVDLGTQHSEKYDSDTRQIRFEFELVDEKYVFDEDRGEQSFIVGRNFSLNLGKKAHLRKNIESWIAKALKDNTEFDIGSLAGEPCQIQIVHTEKNAEGNQYANISNILPPPKKGKVARAENDIVVFDLDNFDKEVFNSLPEWMQEIIKKSAEYKDILTSGKLAGGKNKPAKRR